MVSNRDLNLLKKLNSGEETDLASFGNIKPAALKRGITNFNDGILVVGKLVKSS